MTGSDVIRSFNWLFRPFRIYACKFFELCVSDYNGFYVLVTRVTNMDATLNRKIMDATVKDEMHKIIIKIRLYDGPAETFSLKGSKSSVNNGSNGLKLFFGEIRTLCI